MIDPKELTSNNIYDLIADEYPLAFDANYTQFLKYVLLERFSKPTDICLDIGIGNGIFSIPLASRVRAVHGVDINLKMLQLCPRNLQKAGVSNVSLYYRSATNLLFPDNFFDMVFSYSTLLMVPKPERAYREIARVLKPRGIAILDICGKYNLSRIYWARYYRRQGHFGVNSYAVRAIEMIFQSLGFEIVERHAAGLLDQWKYIPGLTRLTCLNKIFHRSARTPDVDYAVSHVLPAFADRWYFVLRRHGSPRISTGASRPTPGIACPEP